MRICIDLDGTICEYQVTTGDYATVRPLPQAAETIRQWRASGHYIILSTARHMKTCGGNVGQVVARQGRVLFSWLEEHGIEYDEIHFGKPTADPYLDDNAMRFEGNWQALRDGMTWQRLSAEQSGKINLVITMAGAGSRFSKAGYDLPKPLIPAFGEPMYRHAVRSLPLHLAGRLVFVILDDAFADRLDADIRANFGGYDPRVLRVAQVTRGQAETLLAAAPALAFNLPLLVHNADSAYLGSGFEDVYQRVDGAILGFTSSEPRWSYAAIDAVGRVTEVREKVVISSHASTGTYYFRSSVQALDLAREAVEKNVTERGEFYIAPLYNAMIAARQNIALVEVDRFVCYGTPEDLQRAEADPENQTTMAQLRSNHAAPLE